MLRFRSQVGHAYAPETLGRAQKDALEQALWAALRALEDQIALNRRLAHRAQERGHRHSADAFRRYEEAAVEQANTIRAALNKRADGVPESVPARDRA
jgi:two-component system chemotaxis response regulator CheB